MSVDSKIFQEEQKFIIYTNIFDSELTGYQTDLLSWDEWTVMWWIRTRTRREVEGWERKLQGEV